ncbi:hypothetical protein B9Z55_028206 [Caenorhabditis nigoni]|uniref:Uncharacterized protein n=1 Tax=Caenorhabditis nigoni TaxID=1611254 RepID=A0A2G5SC54_9PELO|nr:hypothetical protein B9Z55_028206 [Caenorhabditis nigoni]
MDKPFNSGPDGSRVQIPDDQRHDAENMYSRIRKRRVNEICESHLNGTTSMPNVRTATNTTIHSNATNSTVDRLANNITILDLEKKYGETIELYKKASAEVERLKRLEKSHREKLEELISKRRLCQNSSNWDSYTRRICDTLLLIHANEEDIKKVLEIEASTKVNKETAEAEWKLETTNNTNHSNATNSTEDRLADKKTIQNFGNKYGETLPLHKKASAEVKRANRHKKKRPGVNRSEWIWNPSQMDLGSRIIF